MQRARKSTNRGPGKGRRRQGNPALGDGVLMHVTHPPALNSYEIEHKVRLRFATNAAVASNITYQNLLDTVLMVTGATAGFDLFDSVKIRAIEAWANPALGSATTITIQFDGQVAGSVGDLKTHTDTSMGTQPAHVFAKPDPRTLAAMFQVSAGAAAFTITGPTGMVVDALLTFKTLPGNPNAAQNPLVGATVGDIVYRGLDGVAAATTKFVPVVLPFF